MPPRTATGTTAGSVAGPVRTVPVTRRRNPAWPAAERIGGRRSRREHMATVFVSMAGVAGCYGVAIADLCRRVGVSNRAFYQTFSSKEECFVFGFDLLAGPMLDRAQASFEAAGSSWEERAGAGLTSILTEMAADPAWARSCTMEVLGAGPEAVEHLRALILRGQQIFEFPQRGCLVPGPGRDPLCSMAVGAILQPIHGYLRADRADLLPGLVPGFVSFLSTHRT